MYTLGTKFTFCHHRYIRAGAYEKYLQSSHPDFWKNLYKPKTDLLCSCSSSVNSSKDLEVLANANERQTFGFNESDYKSNATDSEPEHTNRYLE